MAAASTPAAGSKLREARQRVIEQKADRMRQSLAAFIRGGAYDVVEDIPPDSPSDLPLDDTKLRWNWHHELYCRAAELVTEGTITRLGVNAPPGTLKSQIFNVFWPAWEWTHDPSIESVTASTNVSTAKRDCDECRTLVKSDWYQRYFEFDVRRDKDGKTDFGSTQKGEYKATSVGSKDIGSHWDRVRVDDPVGPREAYSHNKREENIRWFQEVMSDRLNDPKESALVVVGHRVHDADLFGVLQDGTVYEWLVLEEEYEPGWANPSTLLARGDDDTEDLDPCVGADPRSEAGELLHPERRGAKEIREFKETEGVSMAAAKLQQKPTTPGGEIIRGDWLQRQWTSTGRFEESGTELVIYVDPKGGSRDDESSRASVQLWWRDDTLTVGGDEEDGDGNNATLAALIDERFGVWNQPTTLEALRFLLGLDRAPHPQAFTLWDQPASPLWRKADRLVFENKADGPSLRDHLQAETAIPIGLAKPWAGKRQRIEDSTGYWQAGSVLLPPDDCCQTVSSFIDQAVKYPRSEHDDRIDCAAYAIQDLLGHRLTVEYPQTDDDTSGNFGWRKGML